MLIGRTRAAAVTAACLSQTSRVFGILSLAWGSAVLLGALLNQLQLDDFYTVAALLLAEALRYSTADVTTRMLVSPLFSMQGKSSARRSLGKDLQQSFAVGVFIATMVLQLGCTAAGLALSSWRLSSRALDVRSQLRVTASSFNGNAALKIFYALVIANSALASLYWFVELLIWCWLRDKRLPLVFSHQVLMQCCQDGVWLGLSANFPELAVCFMALELSRGVTRRNTIRDLQLVTWFIPLLTIGDEGLDILISHLCSDNRYQQQASIILLSLWPDRLAVVTAPEVISVLLSKLRCTLLGHTVAEAFVEILRLELVHPDLAATTPYSAESVLVIMALEVHVQELVGRLMACIQASANYSPWFLRALCAVLDVEELHQGTRPYARTSLFIKLSEYVRDVQDGKQLRKAIWSFGLLRRLHGVRLEGGSVLTYQEPGDQHHCMAFIMRFLRRSANQMRSLLARCMKRIRWSIEGFGPHCLRTKGEGNIVPCVPDIVGAMLHVID